MLQFILLIILGLALTVFLAKGIVSFIPKKYQPFISVGLWVLIIFLGYSVYNGIMQPINFNKSKVVKYAHVVDHLKMIRDAELAHKQIIGNYTANGDDLVKFIDTAQFAIIENRDTVVTVRKGRITVEEEHRIVDTIGYEPVRNLFKNRNYKDMMNVPGTDVKFDLKTGFVEKTQGLKVPVFMAKVDKAIVLKGEEISLVKQEKEMLGGDEVRGAFLSVGSLEDVVTNGNWPPLYDKAEKQKARANKE
ncbi:MAG: hypothetical protein L3J45_08600 [Flavobacteriaceae bacterium]|nr:hypothetical protein [Flavobacteriaceae bacterium]